MENQLIELYLLACHVYDTRSETCFQRLSNNSKPDFTDQELVAIYLFGHLQGMFEKKAIHRLIDNYWRHYFPYLPAYQTFVARLNLLEQSFQTIGGYLNELLAQSRTPEIDHIIDSVPVMLARGGHAYRGISSKRAKNYSKEYQKVPLNVKISMKPAESDFSLSTLRTIIACNTNCTQLPLIRAHIVRNKHGVRTGPSFLTKCAKLSRTVIIHDRVLSCK